MNRKQRRAVNNQPNVFAHKGFIYSFSGRNKYGEYVVIKMDQSEGDVKIMDTRIIKASSIKNLQKLIDTVPFENFKQFENNSLQ